jgi:uncharacterized protein YndB with AHSA1/START domain
MHFSATVTFPREEVFDYVSDPRHWSEFFPAVESVEQVEGWDAPGGRCRVLLRLPPGRRQWLDYELTEFDRPRLYRDVARATGEPDEHERVFVEVAQGTRLESTIRHPPRPGVAGLLERVVLRWVVRRMYDRAGVLIAARLADR